MRTDGIKEELGGLRVAFAVFSAVLASVLGAVFTLDLPDGLRTVGFAVAIMLGVLIIWIGIRYYVLVWRLYDDR